MIPAFTEFVSCKMAGGEVRAEVVAVEDAIGSVSGGRSRGPAVGTRRREDRDTMSIAEQIQQDTKAAMKNRDRRRVETLRMLNAALKNGEIEAGRSLSEEEEQAVLKRQLKQRQESAEAFGRAGRDEQAASEAAEAEVVREYLPAPLSEEELGRIVERAIEETGASGMKEMGAVMGRATALAGGRADGRQLAALVRGRLQ